MHFVIAAVWFTVLSIAAERGFWWFIGSSPGYQWGAMVAVWSFIFGGLFGPGLMGQAVVSIGRIVGVGVLVPVLTLLASGMSFGVIGAVRNMLDGRSTDGLLQLLFSPLIGLAVGGSGLIVTFWLILPVGVLGSWLLSCWRPGSRWRKG